MRRGSDRGGWIMLLMVLCGLTLGGFLGELLGKYVPLLKYGYDLGVSTHEWDFNVLRITFGFSFKINLFSILGIALALYFYRRL